MLGKRKQYKYSDKELILLIPGLPVPIIQKQLGGINASSSWYVASYGTHLEFETYLTSQ